MARGAREARVDLLEAVIEVETGRDASDLVTHADQTTEALVAHDGVVLRDELRRIVDEHVAVAEEVLRVVVEKLRLGGPSRAHEVRVADARAQRELAIGERDRAA